ncbi:hypothetical protein [Agrobacterium albertimagni]|nr:hypothetical protein [Agrobacterium albertimagni]
MRTDMSEEDAAPFDRGHCDGRQSPNPGWIKLPQASSRLSYLCHQVLVPPLSQNERELTSRDVAVKKVQCLDLIELGTPWRKDDETATRDDLIDFASMLRRSGR